MLTAGLKKIGHYLTVRKLGQGGMGVVYAAVDELDSSRGEVALKVISTQPGTGAEGEDETSRRFLREAKILERLRHPNIVTFYEVGSEKGQHYFAMEMLSGSPLSKYLGKPWRDVLPLLIQICHGMDYLATRHIIHRDLSPDNVFIVREGDRLTAKILDFGIAKDTTGEETLHNFTVTGVLVGKPQYWSPEQIGNVPEGESIDFRSDVYSLGVIFYRMLAGELPFKADDPMSYISLHLMEPAPELKAPPGLPALPPDVAGIVRRMLEKDRRNRPQSYREIVAVFHAALGQPLDDHEQLTSPELLLAAPPTREMPASGVSRPSRITEAWEEPTVRKPFGWQETGQLSKTKQTVQIHEEMPTQIGPLGRTAAIQAAGDETVLDQEPVKRRGPRLAIAAAVLAAAGVAGYVATRPSTVPEAATTAPPASGSGSPASGRTEPPLVAGEGGLALNSIPWSTVVAIVDSSTQKQVESYEGKTITTPATLKLPAGHYSVRLTSGLGGETDNIEVDVVAGQTVEHTARLVDVEKAVDLLN